MADGTLSVFAGTIVIGLVHGAEPGHGWPIAAAYALDKSHRWLAGLSAGLVIGVGHLISSIAVVGAFLLFASLFGAENLGWLRYVAGALLILLGVRELHHGHGHSHGSGPDHDHDHQGDDGHDHHHSDHPDEATADHDSRGGHEHNHVHGHDHGADLARAADERGLAGIASAAFVLGFVHEEEFQILGLCTGAASRCVELMLVYAFAVICALVAFTLLLVAGFEHYEDRLGRYATYFPVLSGVVLILMGLGFLFGLI